LLNKLLKILKKIFSSKKNSKNTHRQIKSNSWFRDFIDLLIEHHFFKPISLSIILCFAIFKSYDYANYYFAEYREKEYRKIASTAIKINISDVQIDFDIEEDQILERRIKQGDTLLKILSDLGSSEQDIFAILNSLKKHTSVQNLGVGDMISVTYRSKIQLNKTSKENSNQNDNVNRKVIVNSVTISPTPNTQFSAYRNQDGTYNSKEENVKLTRYISRYYGSIKKGLFVDGVNAGISPTSMMNMINLYGYDIDFQRDLHKGDKFEMLVESFYNENGKKIRDGNVLYSSIILSNRTIDIYMHKIDEKIEYFDSKGNSVKKSLLRTPINGARVSSGFGMRRHPILGYSKMHKGSDFAAPTGTPIMAAGSGVVAYMAVKGGYGNYVQIKHNQDYATAYGHASRFNKKFRVGSKVKQGDIVAYVGSTGRSTGPHLHFEVLFKGEQVNPAKVKATSGIKLAGKDLAKFEISREEIDKYRRNIPNLIKK
jgi:murein DD-endopeptidase MepM/ murein hydrolase activator NlpD